MNHHHRRLQLSTLHAQKGDTTLTFDINNEEDVKKAKAQITDMLRLGYSIFVVVDGKTERITKFDASKGSYQINGKTVESAKVEATAVAPTAGGCLVAAHEMISSR